MRTNFKQAHSQIWLKQNGQIAAFYLPTALFQWDHDHLGDTTLVLFSLPMS